MSDELASHPPTEPGALGAKPAPVFAGPPRTDGRCDQCGYSLVGLPRMGVCPECGSEYTNASALRLQPWPSALAICLRLGWPLLALGIVVALASQSSGDGTTLMVLGWALAVVAPVNAYSQVRSILKKSLPEQKRTRGPIFAMRAIGTTVCVLLFFAMIAPLIFFVGCLIVGGGAF